MSLMGKSRPGRALSLRAACLVAASLLSAGFSPARGAEYKGRNLDGKLFDAVALARDTGRRYEVKVEFEEDRVIVIFPPCARLSLTMDGEVIKDPLRIPASDFGRGVDWEISLDADSLGR